MGVRVYIQDARSVRYCSRGLRAFCESHGLDWELFLKEGLDSDDLEKIDDAMLKKVIDNAKRRVADAG